MYALDEYQMSVHEINIVERWKVDEKSNFLL